MSTYYLSAAELPHRVLKYTYIYIQYIYIYDNSHLLIFPTIQAELAILDRLISQQKTLSEAKLYAGYINKL